MKSKENYCPMKCYNFTVTSNIEILLLTDYTEILLLTDYTEILLLTDYIEILLLTDYIEILLLTDYMHAPLHYIVIYSNMQTFMSRLSFSNSHVFVFLLF